MAEVLARWKRAKTVWTTPKAGVEPERARGTNLKSPSAEIIKDQQIKEERDKEYLKLWPLDATSWSEPETVITDADTAFSFTEPDKSPRVGMSFALVRVTTTVPDPVKVPSETVTLKEYKD